VTLCMTVTTVTYQSHKSWSWPQHHVTHQKNDVIHYKEIMTLIYIAVATTNQNDQ